MKVSVRPLFSSLRYLVSFLTLVACIAAATPWNRGGGGQNYRLDLGGGPLHLYPRAEYLLASDIHEDLHTNI